MPWTTPHQRLILIRLLSDTSHSQPTHEQALARLQAIYEEVTAVLQHYQLESDNDDEN
jgi:hypothetical protein